MATDAISNDSLTAIPPECLPVVDHLVTEDGAPVDNVFSEKEQRLLTEPLFSSWPGPEGQRRFVAMANVGLFYSVNRPPLVPDAMLSLRVELFADLEPKNHRSYFIWEYGKAPDVVIEIVSNREGGEDTDKLAAYARIGIRYYVIHDPYRLLGPEELRAYRLEGLGYKGLREPLWLPDVGLGLALWNGRFEDSDATWLRWIDETGAPISTGQERAEAERQRADAERQRADQEQQRAEQLAAQLRQLGVESGE